MIASEHRPTEIEVNLTAISDNVAIVQESLPPKTAVFAVVKANAYGHGAIPVARELMDQVDGFCVSNLDEALELRQNGIESPILILGVIPAQYATLALSLNLSLTVASLDWLRELAGQGEDLKGLAIHLKLDTGMGRLGLVSDQDVEEALAQIGQLGLQLEGVYTHFARADEVDSGYYDQQVARFRHLLSLFPVLPAKVHASNSAASIWHLDSVFSMVRLGNVIYGLNPSGGALDLPDGIEPALSLTSQIVHVKEVETGTSLGYGGTYQSPTREWIATLPIGYADGLTRKLQGFSVLVEGQACPIVGRVSMDQIMIRLPHRYPLGTRVTLIGQDGGQERTAQDWASYLGTIHYEIVCLLSNRIARRYVHHSPDYLSEAGSIPLDEQDN